MHVSPRSRPWALSMVALLAGCAADVSTEFATSRACKECHEVGVAASPHATALHARLPSDPIGVGTAPADVTAAMSRATFMLGETWLAQPLVPGPRGRLQALPVGWDVVKREWFDLAPEHPTTAQWDHWQNPGMTANTHCLYCHTTGYRSRYDITDDRYTTTWSEPGVQCESCHGPRGMHAASRRAGSTDAPPARSGRSHESNTTCAPCHMRRTQISDGWEPGSELFDYFDPDLLDTDVFAPDGTLVGEAFEWTSFAMSVMAANGVTCTACHDPHLGTLKAEGNALCLQCHESQLAARQHTHHPEGSSGSLCVACHMPATTFMQRDVRRDHVFPRPDPDLSASLGTRDPCTDCHTDRSQTWAAATVRSWWGEGDERRRRVARTFANARAGDVTAAAALVEVLTGPGDAIRRASAARLLGAFTVAPLVAETLRASAADPSPLVRAAVMGALGAIEPLAAPTMDTLVGGTRDPIRLVRVEAAFALRTVQRDAMAKKDQAVVEAATQEWFATQDLMADMPTAHFNQGVFLAARGDRVAAEQAYRRAISLWSDTLPARQNLAMLLARQGRIRDAETEFRLILDREPGWPAAAFSLALLLADQERFQEARALLEACVARDSSYPRALLNLGLVYARLGDTEKAYQVLERATHEGGTRAEAVGAIVTLARKHGDEGRLRRWTARALDGNRE